MKFVQREKAQDFLREALAKYAIGLDVTAYKKHDAITAYPTRNTHIHKVRLVLRGKLCLGTVLELLKQHLLSVEEFSDWNAEAWDL
jgi:hypothetical protein